MNSWTKVNRVYWLQPARTTGGSFKWSTRCWILIHSQYGGSKRWDSIVSVWHFLEKEKKKKMKKEHYFVIHISRSHRLPSRLAQCEHGEDGRKTSLSETELQHRRHLAPEIIRKYWVEKVQFRKEGKKENVDEVLSRFPPERPRMYRRLPTL